MRTKFHTTIPAARLYRKIWLRNSRPEFSFSFTSTKVQSGLFLTVFSSTGSELAQTPDPAKLAIFANLGPLEQTAAHSGSSITPDLAKDVENSHRERRFAPIHASCIASMSPPLVSRNRLSGLAVRYVGGDDSILISAVCSVLALNLRGGDGDVEPSPPIHEGVIALLQENSRGVGLDQPRAFYLLS